MKAITLTISLAVTEIVVQIWEHETSKVWVEQGRERGEGSWSMIIRLRRKTPFPHSELVVIRRCGAGGAPLQPAQDPSPGQELRTQSRSPQTLPRTNRVSCRCVQREDE